MSESKDIWIAKWNIEMMTSQTMDIVCKKVGTKVITNYCQFGPPLKKFKGQVRVNKASKNKDNYPNPTTNWCCAEGTKDVCSLCKIVVKMNKNYFMHC